MQYRTGTVSVTAGSSAVVGVGTLWLAELAVGSIFTILNSNVWYQVASITDDTHLTLSANYGGTTAAGVEYAVTRDFTTNYGFPYPIKGDVETAAVVARALIAIDAKIRAVIVANSLITP